jgi:hypothetical protein
VSIFLPVFLCLTKRIVRDRPVLKQKPQGLTAWIMQYVAAHMSEDSGGARGHSCWRLEYRSTAYNIVNQAHAVY